MTVAHDGHHPVRTGQLKWLLDPYQDWAEAEGLPIYGGLAVDLPELETAPWPRFDVDGALVHIDARGDFLSMYVMDIRPGGSTSPTRHLYEAVIYVLDGQGSTTIETPSGESRSFEWQRGSLIAIPLNSKHRHFNGSGQNRARLIAVTNLPMVMKLYRTEDFIFNTDFSFEDRWETHSFDGGGTFIENREHRHLWETSFVPDLLAFQHLQQSPSRGTGSTNIVFTLAEGVLHGHCSEIPPYSFKKAHRHGDGFHIIQLSGKGYSLYWYEGDEPERVDWQYGTLHTPPNEMFHQHFNTSTSPGRYVAIGFGSSKYPFTAEKMQATQHDYRVKHPKQIEYEDQDPKIDEMFQLEVGADKAQN